MAAVSIRNLRQVNHRTTVTSQKSTLAMMILAGALLSFLPSANLNAYPSAAARSEETPVEVVKTYLRANRARDFQTAYRYISARDRTVRDQRTYVRSQDGLAGFALDLASRLAASMEVWVIARSGAATTPRLEVGYRALTADELSTSLRGWNQERLNALPAEEQNLLRAAVESLRKSGKAITIEGRETFDLVHEQAGWKIHLDWPSHERVLLNGHSRPPLLIEFLRDDILVKRDEPFQIDLRVTNRSERGVFIALHHLFEPRHAEKNIEMIACGSLAPFALGPRQTQEISSAYLLRGSGKPRSPLKITYDFRPFPTRRHALASAPM